MNTTVINLVSGPGAGKSTMGADLYARMKREGKDVELVREVAKKYVLQGHHIGPFEQISILGEQIKEESYLFGKVKFIVTDSPSLLGGFYCRRYGQIFMSNMVYDYYKYSKALGITFVNYVVPRTEKYVQEGRVHTELESREIDLLLEDYMNSHDYKFKKFVNHSYNMVLDEIIKELK